MVNLSELNQLFTRDLNRLSEMISTFELEDHLWQTPKGISNSCGHLTLHICGNIRHFIGHVLGKSDYIRQREQEFTAAPISAVELKHQINLATLELQQTLTSDLDISGSYPIRVFGKDMSTEFFLLHLYGHLSYHMGQIDYLKRLVHLN